MTRGLASLLGTIVIICGCGGTEGNAAMRSDTMHAYIPRETANRVAALDSGGATPAEVALGDSVFNGLHGDGKCASCHGQNGVGTGSAPTLNDRNWINGDGSLGYIEGTVYEGVPKPLQHPLPMPAFGHTLTERQLHAVAVYVFALSHGGVPQR